jgi:lipopolysaccharide/colanic/teichoic acid biosynthesis glycosyltransferase
MDSFTLRPVSYGQPFTSADMHPARRPVARLAKRGVDVAIAASAIVCLSPLFALIAVAIKISSPGPVLFRDVRVGIRLRTFTMFKFRTMVADADERRGEMSSLNEAKGVIFKIRDDPRVTTIGRLLRRSSLDELPQLFNVLRGEMSLVGPRPLAPWIVMAVRDQEFYRRFSVLPGMTGRWQVNGRVQDSTRMLQDDLEYVESWSLIKDLAILAATVPAVFRFEGV